MDVSQNFWNRKILQSQIILRFFGCQTIMVNVNFFIFFRQKSIPKIDFGHFFCPFLKSRIYFWEKNMHFLHIDLTFQKYNQYF
jgi:hypothetical protein